jgi:hypothetical protein
MLIMQHPTMDHLSDEQRWHIFGLIYTIEQKLPNYLEQQMCYGNARALVLADTTGRVTLVDGLLRSQCPHCTQCTEKKKCTQCDCGVSDHCGIVPHAWNRIDGVEFDISIPLLDIESPVLDEASGTLIPCSQKHFYMGNDIDTNDISR